MKSITWLLISQLLFILNALCNDNILSKFYQNNFKIKDVREELKYFNEDYFYYFAIKTYKFNRTTPAINATFRMKQTVKDKCEVLVQAYKFLSNEYRTFPVHFQVNLKKAVESNAIGSESIRKCGNITDLYFKKDFTYYYCNFLIDETKFPPLIPNGRYKIEQKLLYLEEEIAVINLFGEVYTPIYYPKNKKGHGK